MRGLSGRAALWKVKCSYSLRQPSDAIWTFMTEEMHRAARQIDG